jgi:hypothetical protein
MFQEHASVLPPEPDDSSPHPLIIYRDSDHETAKYVSVVSLCMLHAVPMEIFLKLIIFLSGNYVYPDVTSLFLRPKVLITAILKMVHFPFSCIAILFTGMLVVINFTSYKLWGGLFMPD